PGKSSKSSVPPSPPGAAPPAAPAAGPRVAPALRAGAGRLAGALAPPPPPPLPPPARYPAERGPPAPLFRPPDLGLLPDIADERCFVQTATHVPSRPMGHALAISKSTQRAGRVVLFERGRLTGR